MGDDGVDADFGDCVGRILVENAKRGGGVVLMVAYRAHVPTTNRRACFNLAGLHLNMFSAPVPPHAYLINKLFGSEEDKRRVFPLRSVVGDCFERLKTRGESEECKQYANLFPPRIQYRNHALLHFRSLVRPCLTTHSGFGKHLLQSSGYLHLQATYPHSVSTALNDSPAGVFNMVWEEEGRREGGGAPSLLSSHAPACLSRIPTRYNFHAPNTRPRMQ